MNTINQGAVVKCQPNGNMEHPFIGTVAKCYENSAMVLIEEFDPQDRMNARELLYKAIISQAAMKVLSPGPAEDYPSMSDAG